MLDKDAKKEPEINKVDLRIGMGNNLDVVIEDNNFHLLLLSWGQILNLRATS